MTGRKVLIAGGSGTIGSSLAEKLKTSGYEVYILTRDPDKISNFKTIYWDPARQEIANGAETDFYGIVNLTGIPLDAHRWTTTYKKKIYNSRIPPARFLRELLWKEELHSDIYIGASAVGIYGDTGDQEVAEGAKSPKDSFIPRLVKSWESAHMDPLFPQVRTLILRFGVVLTTQGGFIPRFEGFARAGLYAYLGDGKQWLSWIHIDDLTSFIQYSLENEMAGTFNVVAPECVRLKDFVQEFKKAREGFGIVAPAPGFVLKLLYGEMADMLLQSLRASSACIEKTDFRFHHPTMQSALQDIYSA